MCVAGDGGGGGEDVSQWKAISLRSLRRKEVKREEIKSGTGKMYEELFPNQLERARELKTRGRQDASHTNHQRKYIIIK